MRNKFETKISEALVRRFGRSQVRYEPVKIDYAISYKYVPDFLVGDDLYIETKGYFRPEDQRKMRAVKDQHPELDLRIIFQTDGKIRGKTRYSDWADKHGFPFAIGSVPKDW